MDVVALRAELYIRSARSLKDKRGVLRPVVEGLRARFHLSVAEVDHQDDHHQATVGVAIVAADAHQAELIADEVERWIWSRPDVEVTEIVRSWLDLEV